MKKIHLTVILFLTAFCSIYAQSNNGPVTKAGKVIESYDYHYKNN